MGAGSGSFQFPLPGLSPRESRVLRQLVVWADEYLAKKQALKGSHGDNPAPTTQLCTKHFQYEHKDMLTLINRMERQGLLIKERQLSGGLTGYGYDGSLFSSVLPTARARQLILQNPN